MLVFIKLILPPSLSLPTGIGYWRENILSVAPTTSEENLTHTRHKFTEPPVLIPGTPLLYEIPQDQAPQTTAESPSPAMPVVSHLNTLTWQAVVFVLWLVGVLIFSALLIQRILFVNRLIAQSESAENRFTEIVNQCSEKMGIHRPIDLRLSNTVSSPAVCGFLKPVILMPTTLIEKLPQDQLRAVLIHELCHIKRGDLWINSIQTTLQIIYFYNPLVWLANLIVRRIREQAVDEMVLVTLGAGAKVYSNTLIDIAEMAFFKTYLSLRLIGVVESKKALSRRIKHILHRPFPKSAKLGVFGLLAIIIAGAILLPMASGHSTNNASLDQDTLIKFESKSNYLGHIETVGDTKSFSKTYNVQFKKGEKLLVIAELYRASEPMHVLGHMLFDSPAGTEKLLCSFSYSKKGDSKPTTIHHGNVKLGKQEFDIPEFRIESFPASRWWGWFNGDALRQNTTDWRGRDYKAMKVLFYYAGRSSDIQDKAEFWIPASDATPVNVPYAFVLKAIPLSRLKYLYVEPVGGYQGLDGRLIEKDLTVEQAEIIAIEYKQKLTRFVSDVSPLPTGKTNVSHEQNNNELSPFKATLPNGVIVELVGLFTGKNKEDLTWWRPDGTLIPEQEYALYKETVLPRHIRHLETWEFEYGYVLRFTPFDVSVMVNVTVGMQGRYGHPDKDGITINFVESDNGLRERGLPQIGNISVAAACGPFTTKGWSEGSVGSPNRTGLYTESFWIDNDSTIMLTPVRPDRRKPESGLMIDAIVNANDVDMNVIYESKDGKIHKALKSGYGGGPSLVSPIQRANPMMQYTFRLQSIQQEDLKQIAVEYRRFKGITFKNVALCPGLNTDVKIEVHGTVSSTQASVENLDTVRTQLSNLRNERAVLEERIKNYRQMIRVLGNQYGSLDLVSRQDMMMAGIESLHRILTQVEAERLRLEAEIQIRERTKNQSMSQGKLLSDKRNELEKKKAFAQRIRETLAQQDTQTKNVGRMQLSIDDFQAELKSAQEEYNTLISRMRDLEIKLFESQRKFVK
jgi:beta-lactamase regulating signal transducer with metallopeptidase domain